ncbi:hypothetical protein F5B19DRAFT_480387 [Rostrohypoxylon terebratum]|nr:hypothetical protein F5B19DRAFT_480387 [Rostrohypoxylon terebratum]
MEQMHFWEVSLGDYSIPNNACYSLHRDSREEATFFWGGIIGGLIFGSIHLFAWNSPFPTDIERILWISSSFITALCPLLSYAIEIGDRALMKNHRVSDRRLVLRNYTNIISTVVPFVLARLLLIMEMFRSLYFLPPDAYLNTWTTNIAHVGG